jgi:hypothetical protein
MAFVQPAIARAHVALNAPVVEGVPITPGLAGNGLIHRALGLSGKAATEMVIGRQRGKMRADLHNAAIRSPCVAGRFYPVDPERLRAEVLRLLSTVSLPPNVVAPKALIAPHAGYIYSGSVAAAAFAALRIVAQRITRVVLIGPAHYVAVHGIAAPMAT